MFIKAFEYYDRTIDEYEHLDLLMMRLLIGW